MNPEGDKILGLATQRLAANIAPLLNTAFAKSQEPDQGSARESTEPRLRAKAKSAQPNK